MSRRTQSRWWELFAQLQRQRQATFQPLPQYAPCSSHEMLQAHYNVASSPNSLSHMSWPTTTDAGSCDVQYTPSVSPAPEDNVEARLPPGILSFMDTPGEVQELAEEGECPLDTNWLRERLVERRMAICKDLERCNKDLERDELALESVGQELYRGQWEYMDDQEVDELVSQGDYLGWRRAGNMGVQEALDSALEENKRQLWENQQKEWRAQVIRENRMYEEEMSRRQAREELRVRELLMKELPMWRPEEELLYCPAAPLANSVVRRPMHDKSISPRAGLLLREKYPNNEHAAKGRATQREKYPNNEHLAKGHATIRQKYPNNEHLTKSRATIRKKYPKNEHAAKGRATQCEKDPKSEHLAKGRAAKREKYPNNEHLAKATQEFVRHLLAGTRAQEANNSSRRFLAVAWDTGDL